MAITMKESFQISSSPTCWQYFKHTWLFHFVEEIVNLTLNSKLSQIITDYITNILNVIVFDLQVLNRFISCFYLKGKMIKREAAGGGKWRWVCGVEWEERERIFCIYFSLPNNWDWTRLKRRDRKFIQICYANGSNQNACLIICCFPGYASRRLEWHPNSGALIRGASIPNDILTHCATIADLQF